MNTAALRLAYVALPLWALWSALIVAARPGHPGTVAQVLFGVSTLAAFIGCCWATWPALPSHAARPWHRVATLVLAGVAFVVLLGCGHALGLALAAH